jgi:hypothetical protein
MPEVAVRLSATLPGYTHTQRAPERDVYGKLVSHKKKMSLRWSPPISKPGVGRGNNQGKPCEYKGKKYETKIKLMREHHICSKTFYNLLDEGKIKRL